MTTLLQETGPPVSCSLEVRTIRQQVYVSIPRGENGCVMSGARLRIAICALSCALAASATTLPQTAPATTDAHLASASDARVDINTANLDELMKVPGMTRTWAARIIRFRPYRAKNDLVDRGVVTGQVYDRIKDHIIAHRAKQ
jgi:DNA uptake protein ComE-like DNA-binding protein